MEMFLFVPASHHRPSCLPFYLLHSSAALLSNAIELNSFMQQEVQRMDNLMGAIFKCVFPQRNLHLNWNLQQVLIPNNQVLFSVSQLLFLSECLKAKNDGVQV